MKESILTNYGLKPQKYFLYVGNAYPHKNLARVIEAAMMTRTILAVSCARNVFTHRLQELAEKMGAKENVKLLGFVPDEDLEVLYKNSIGFVFASLMEGFGIPGLEAMINGTLLLCSDIPVFKEVYKDNAIYFNPFDFSDIADKLKTAIDMPENKRKEIAKKAKEFVKRYSWQKMAEETVKLYAI